MGEVFIAGETIEEALAHGRSNAALALCSYDMLGEGARTEADAERYFDAYAQRDRGARRINQRGSLHDRSRHLREAFRARAALFADAARARA